MHEWFSHFAGIYGKKNSLLMPGLQERAIYLLKATRYMQDCLRKHSDKKPKLEKALASLFSRMMAVADNFRDFPFVIWLCRKYPESGCGYCWERPCICAKGKRNVNMSAAVPKAEQIHQPLCKWQSDLFATYGDHNRKTGIEGTMLRLFAEVTEVFMLTVDVSFHAQSPQVIEREYAEELADVFSWICALASLLEIDLATAIQKTYGEGCPGCRLSECRCTQILVVDGMVESVNSMPARSLAKA